MWATYLDESLPRKCSLFFNLVYLSFLNFVCDNSINHCLELKLYIAYDFGMEKRKLVTCIVILYIVIVELKYWSIAQ